MKKLIFPIITLFCILIACNNNDDDTSNEELMITEEVVEVEETCQDNIKNQDEVGVDCGGVCTPCEAGSFTLEEGNYRGLWNSNATNGSVYTDLNVTATITKISDAQYSGILYISDTFTSCCNASGTNGDGVITITILNGAVTFKWVDEIPGCTGVFNATGMITENDKIKLNLTGNDCEGNHTGSIEFFK